MKEAPAGPDEVAQIPRYLRKNTHHQMLVDVGVVLRRAHGADYARKFLVESGVAEHVIERVVSCGKVRMMMHK